MYAGILKEGDDFSRSGGTFTFEPYWEGREVEIEYQVDDGGTWQSALTQLGLSMKTGTLGQSTWSYLTSNHPEQAIGYSGLAYLYASSYELTSSAQVDNHSFEVSTPSEFSDEIFDANPADIVKEFLTDGLRGSLWPASKLYSLANYSNYCVSHGIFLSPALTEQKPASEWLSAWLKLTNSDIVWSATKLKIVPLGDESKTANGATYTAVTTPQYDLTPLDFVTEGDDEPRVRIIPRQNEDAVNHVRIEFKNRANAYALEIMPAKDVAHIEQFGERVGEVIKAHEICDPDVAAFAAQMELQRQMSVWNDYEFSLPWTKGRLEPLDLVTLTDPDVFLDRVPARMKRIVESDNGRFDCEASDAPINHASAPKYGRQAGTGYKADYLVAPGNARAPYIFEAPVNRTTTGLEVYLATAGQGKTWGGCRVWCSLDGTSYKEIAQIRGGSRYGTLTGAAAGGVLPVKLNAGQLLPGSTEDAEALATLCYVGGATPEYLAYTGATLTGTLAYDLGGLVRAAYGTSSSAHAAGDPFVRVDQAVAGSGSLDLGYIGKKIWFKLTSWNIYGAAEQSLADVVAYSYTITGKMAKLPPAQPTGGSYSNEPFGIRLGVAQNVEPDVVGYRWSVGASFATSQVLEQRGGTSYFWQPQAGGAFTAWVCAVDKFGNLSTPLRIDGTVGGPNMTSLVAQIVGTDLQLDYTAEQTSFAVGVFEIAHGSSYEAATVVGQYQATRFNRKVDWGGMERWWVTPIDVKANRGAPRSIDVTIAAPGPVLASRVKVIDNNALLYWEPPSIGSLPIELYDVREGDSYESGRSVGSNGTSTFTPVFEELGGDYVYWVVPTDSAGNVGPAVAIPATISQPPDYVLRVNIDSTLEGALTNMYREGGAILGPVLLQSAADHFTSNGWLTPQDQVDAGYPLYAEPSTTGGSYDEAFDYGAVLPATTITVTAGVETVAGEVATACQIYYKALAGDPWIAAAPGFAAVASNFQFARVVLNFGSTAGANLAKLTSLNVKLANKLKTDSGSYTITDADAGVFVPFGVPFIDADTPICQANGSTPVFEIVSFADVPYPTGFTVFHLNTAGTMVTGSGSFTARGF